MINLDGFVKLTVEDVTWSQDGEGEIQWKPKNQARGKSYCLLLPTISGKSFTGKPLFDSFRNSEERK
jgi:hypothetical protein